MAFGAGIECNCCAFRHVSGSVIVHGLIFPTG
jgi:hypothetical protein